eukprot:2278975-Karenia_brevis.AAC.1
MMLDADEWGAVTESEPPVRPYMDEKLAASPKLYFEFISDLYGAGMLDFTDEPLDIVTPFFVGKKDGNLRLVWDCRVPNRRFKKSPAQALGTGRAWSRLSLPDGPTGRETHLY